MTFALNQAKHNSFKRVSAGRVQSIKNQARLITNLSSSNYDFTPKEIEDMFNEIEKSISYAKAAFKKRLGKMGEII